MNTDPIQPNSPRGAYRSARRGSRAGLFLAAVMLSVSATGSVQAGDAAAGRAKAAQCQPCHGLDGLSKLPEAPHIAGQPEQYLIKSMRAYRQGARKDELMTLVAKQLSLEDIDNLAAYYSAIEFSVKQGQ